MKAGKSNLRGEQTPRRSSVVSVQIQQFGHLRKTKSRTAISRSIRSVAVPIIDNRTLEHYLVIPPDGGYGWVIVSVAFIANFLIDGCCYTFGIFLSEIAESFNTEPSKVAMISSLMSGLYYLSGPIACALCNRCGFRFVAFLGAIASAAVFTVATYLENFQVFVLFVGIGTGLSFNFVYTAALLVVGFYFEKYRALATSLSVTGTSLGIILFPRLFQDVNILGQYHWTWKFIILSANFVFLSLLLLAFKPIEPTKILETKNKDIDLGSMETTLHMDEDSEILNFRKVFEKYHNTVFPTIAEYDVEQSDRKDNVSTYIAILEETGSFTSTMYRVPSVSSGSVENKRFLCGLSSCCRRNDEKRVCCSDSKCCQYCRNFWCGTQFVTRPMYRDDILYHGSLFVVPEYSSAKQNITVNEAPAPYTRLSRDLSYHMSISRVISQKDIEQQRECVCCPEAVLRVLITMLDVRLFKSISFSILTLSGYLTTMGLYVPLIFMVERGRELGFDSYWQNQLLSIMGFTNLVGRILCGVISLFPKIDAVIVSWVSLIAAGSMMLMSGFVYHLEAHILSVVVFGLGLASFSCLRTAMIVNILGLENLTNAFGITILFYGIANFMGIPTAVYIRESTGSYQYCFVMAGCSLAVSGILLIPLNKIANYEQKKRRARA